MREFRPYVTHHAKNKEASSTTKVRVVFNGSAITSTGRHCGYNSKLLNHACFYCKHLKDVPPNSDPPILLQVPVYIMAPLYIRTCIHHLSTITNGLTSRPYRSLRTLQQLALDEAAQVLLRDVFLLGLSVEETLQLKLELVSLLEHRGFKPRKWS
ncbi:hypothetical protein PR048_014072 [Dryococelus australis]|uniref:Uncharacterized protein n=1 Tax=Dryococelus australis TaxID=614101 RepID=A0ABQ9HTZ7_9NEOP|nr:hypothetical protein PR048_014072 [Dryococelus australis]